MTSMVRLMVALSVCAVPALPADLDGVLSRAAVSATAFHRDFRQLIADESYTQVYAGSPSSAWRSQSLRSEVAMVADEDDATWYTFRDTFEVNGKPVPGEGRGLLEQALRGPRPASLTEARFIARGSERYVLAGSGRAANAPTFALMVLLPAHQPRFDFTMRGEKRVGDTTLAVVGYREVRGPMFFRDADNQGIPMTGEFWIEPQSGTVFRSQFVVDGDRIVRGAEGRTAAPVLQPTVDFSRIDVEVIYKPNPQLGVTVPVEMKETFSRDSGSRQPLVPQEGTNGATHHMRQRLSCVAKYTNHRRVLTSERPHTDPGRPGAATQR
jgi:hypothetical protein